MRGTVEELTGHEAASHLVRVGDQLVSADRRGRFVARVRIEGWITAEVMFLPPTPRREEDGHADGVLLDGSGSYEVAPGWWTCGGSCE